MSAPVILNFTLNFAPNSGGRRCSQTRLCSRLRRDGRLPSKLPTPAHTNHSTLANNMGCLEVLRKFLGTFNTSLAELSRSRNEAKQLCLPKKALRVEADGKTKILNGLIAVDASCVCLLFLESHTVLHYSHHHHHQTSRHSHTQHGHLRDARAHAGMRALEECISPRNI